MRRFWNYISTIGLKDDYNSLESRCIILANRLNLILLVILIAISIFIAVVRQIEHSNMAFGSGRLLIIIAFCLLNIWLAKRGLIKLFKIVLIFVPSLVFMVVSTAIGFIEDESYVYYPYFIIAFSVIPQLILIRKKELFLFVISISYFFILLLFIDNLLTLFSDHQLKIVLLIDEFYVYYKLSSITIFVFIFLSIFYLRSINFKFEKEIRGYNEELNSAIEELKVTQQHLVQSEKMASLGTLVAGIAHELNNPLNFISGGLDAITGLKERCKENEVKEFEEALRITNEGLDRATNIVKALMTFSYKGTPNLVSTDINLIIENTLLFILPKIPQEVIIEKDYRLENLLSIYPEKIHQVIINIIENAIYSLHESNVKVKKIIISTFLNNNFAVLKFYNTGNQIPDKYLNKIFDPFFTTKSPGKGAGLGLSICYSLIADHNGQIYAENETDGVSFIIKLPID
jgi:signal transduction histidine kinase